MQVYTKLLYCANVKKGWTETDRQFLILIMKGMYRGGTLLRMCRDGTLLRNVQGWNITYECTGMEHYLRIYRDGTLLINVQGRNIMKKKTG